MSRSPLFACIPMVCATATWLLLAPASDAAPASAKRKDSASPLPNSTVIAKVNDRSLTVHDFRERYFAAGPAFQPTTDSAGRAEFLESLINKEVLALVARKVDPPLDATEQATLKEYGRSILSSVLYQRYISDSVSVTEQEIRRMHEQYGWELHLRHILFEDKAVARRVREDLARRKTTWEAAVKKYSVATRDPGPHGDMGWVPRTAARGGFGYQVFRLKPGETSPVLSDIDGYHLVQVVERRAVAPLPYEGIRRMLRRELSGVKSEPLVERLNSEVRSLAKVEYDTTNIRWAAARYRAASAQNSPNQPTIPVAFGPADTGRVLARTPVRTFTVGEFATRYSSVSPLMRAKVYSIAPFISTLDGLFFDSYREQLALARGIEKDPETLRKIELKREELLVEHVYRDSILNRVVVSPAQRRRYFQEHEKEFVSIPLVEFAAVLVKDEASATAMLESLARGYDARTLKAPDDSRGVISTAVRELRQGEQNQYSKQLFEELRPGQAVKMGPDASGLFLVLQSLRYEGSKPLPYEEVQSLVDESVRNLEAERLLKGLLERHRKRFRIETHPELLMSFKLTDPSQGED